MKPSMRSAVGSRPWKLRRVSEVVVETERLRLRTWDEADLDEFISHTNTPEVMRWLGGVSPREAHEQGFARIQGYQSEHGHTLWIVERRSDCAMLGFCGLKRVNSPGATFQGDFEVGWRLRADAWRQGYAKEAAIASLDLAFGKFAAPHVVALTVAGNQPSRGLMHRLGMKRREDLDFIDPRFAPEFNPSIVYRLDAEDWSVARAAALGPKPPAGG